MEYDHDNIDDIVLALMCLTLHDETEGPARTRKGFDWDTLDRLYEKGWILDPKTKSKSVVLTEAGVARSKQLFDQHFGKTTP